MKVKEVTIEYGVTQSLGDYSNTRPSIRVTAEVDEGEDLQQVIDGLSAQAQAYIHRIVDDELEANGRRVKYSKEPRYRIWRSLSRGVFVLAPVGVTMPEESTWRDKDIWRRATFDGHAPDEMRLEKAREELLYISREDPDYAIIDCSDGDLSSIPPLPDPGPEPLWSQKGIAELLRSMNIHESEWESLAELEHVTADWLGEVKREMGWGTRPREFLEVIRSGKLPGRLPEPELDEDYYEEDDEFYDD